MASYTVLIASDYRRYTTSRSLRRTRPTRHASSGASSPISFTKRFRSARRCWTKPRPTSSRSCNLPRHIVRNWHRPIRSSASTRRSGVGPNVVGVFPNDAAIVRLVGALLLEQNDERQLQRRYMQLEGLQTVSNNQTDRVSAVERAEIADPAESRSCIAGHDPWSGLPEEPCHAEIRIFLQLHARDVGKDDRPPERSDRGGHRAYESIGGKLEALYWMTGPRDGFAIVDAPDTASAAAISVAVGSSGAFTHFETYELFPADSLNAILAKAKQAKSVYRPPGS